MRFRARIQSDPRDLPRGCRARHRYKGMLTIYLHRFCLKLKRPLSRTLSPRESEGDRPQLAQEPSR